MIGKMREMEGTETERERERERKECSNNGRLNNWAGTRRKYGGAVFQQSVTNQS